MSDPVTDAFDFEGVISTAVASIFTAGGFAAGTALTLLSDPAFQKKRPRVEIFFKVTGQTLPLRMAVLADSTQRAAAYRGQLEIRAVSDADVAGKATHSAYRAKVRNFCGKLPYQLNGAALTKHRIQSITDSGTQIGLKTADGYEGSVLTFNLDFSIQNDVWATLP